MQAPKIVEVKVGLFDLRELPLPIDPSLPGLPGSAATAIPAPILAAACAIPAPIADPLLAPRLSVVGVIFSSFLPDICNILYGSAGQGFGILNSCLLGTPRYPKKLVLRVKYKSPCLRKSDRQRQPSGWKLVNIYKQDCDGDLVLQGTSHLPKVSSLPPISGKKRSKRSGKRSSNADFVSEVVRLAKAPKRNHDVCFYRCGFAEEEDHVLPKRYRHEIEVIFQAKYLPWDTGHEGTSDRSLRLLSQS